MSLCLWCRRGLLAYVYNGVSDRMNVLNALVAGNGSYIVRPCGHDLHGPTKTILNYDDFFVVKNILAKKSIAENLLKCIFV